MGSSPRNHLGNQGFLHETLVFSATLNIKVLIVHLLPLRAEHDGKSCLLVLLSKAR